MQTVYQDKKNFVRKGANREVVSEPVIKCPYCNYEYLLAEIFIPQYLIRKPEEIERDEEGKIIGWRGRNAYHWETYNCDKCRRDFNVHITMMIDKIMIPFEEQDQGEWT